jgi:hypothetical protein
MTLTLFLPLAISSSAFSFFFWPNNQNKINHMLKCMVKLAGISIIFVMSPRQFLMKKDHNKTKRQIPSDTLLNWREGYLQSVKTIAFGNEYEGAPLLELGNSKIGNKSEHYDKVFVWNLPVVVTCPGASQWCLRHCYNADLRIEKFPINDWNKNLQYYYNDRISLGDKLTQILDNEPGNIAVRIHSSGDFFERDYIDFWKIIISKTPKVKYWAYTRSWSDVELNKSLEELKSLKNIQLFASWDHTMPTPPKSWRKSIVYKDELTFDSGIVCPEQSGKSPNCATCNFCITELKGDVYFILH